MFRAAIAVLAVLAASAAGAAAQSRHVDADAMGEVHRDAGERFASARAISHYLDARRHLRTGNATKALEHLRLAVTYDEESPELRVSLAEALAETGDLGLAEGEARRALELTANGPTASDAHVLLGRIASARHQPEQAALSFRSAIRMETALAGEGEGPDPEPWVLLASFYLESGDEEAAVRTLDDLAVRVPADGSGFREIGRTLVEKHEPGKAERHLRRAVQIDPRDVEALRLLAQAHEALRRPAETREDLLAILRVEPDDGRALLALGRTAVGQGDSAAAREWFHRYLRSAADPPDAHARVVFQWLEGGRPEEALAAARAGLEEAGPDPRLRFAEGLALEELRRWSDAADVLASIRSEAGELFVSARVALADALSRAGRCGRRCSTARVAPPTPSRCSAARSRSGSARRAIPTSPISTPRSQRAWCARGGPTTRSRRCAAPSPRGRATRISCTRSARPSSAPGRRRSRWRRCGRSSR